MTLAAFRADATLWDLSLLGHAVRPADRHAHGQVYYDVMDQARLHPLQVGDGVVRGAADGTATAWRATASALPRPCDSPLWLPANVLAVRESRVRASVSVDGLTRAAPKELPAVVCERLAKLRPGDPPLTVSWHEPLVRAGLKPRGKEGVDPPHVGAVVMGPGLSATLQRNAAGGLELVRLDGGPDGGEETAAKMFHRALAELEEARRPALAAAGEVEKQDKIHKYAKQKVLFVFGQVFRPKEGAQKAEIKWDAEGESFVLSSALQQWSHLLRRQPWRWRPQWIEIAGGSAVQVAREPHGAKATESAFLRSGAGAAFDRQDLHALFRSVDLDRDGFVDWPEFKAAAQKLAAGLAREGAWDEEVARDSFDACDRDGDGRIDEAEWNQCVAYALSMFSPVDLRAFVELLGCDISPVTARTLSHVEGDLDVGLTCCGFHCIRPLRLRPWGADVAQTLRLPTPFRCAEVEDPAAFAAARRQRCTRCNALESQSAFIVCCPPCGDAFPSGWWCTPCVLEAGRPRDRAGRPVSVLTRRRQGQCRRCEQPAVAGWLEQGGGEAERLCNEHAADRLLEEAALCSAAIGRDVQDGHSLAVRVDLRFELEGGVAAGAAEAADAGAEDDREDAEELAQTLETEIFEALCLEGAAAAADRTQVEVTGVQVEGSASVAVAVTLTRAFGRPCPHELFLRLSGLAADPGSELYSEGFQVLRKLAAPPRLLELLVSDHAEQAEMTARMARAAEEEWPRSASLAAQPSPALVVRPQAVLLPRAAVVSVRCLHAPEGSGGRLLAYVLAYPEGARRAPPNFYEFEDFLGKQRGGAKPPHGPGGGGGGSSSSSSVGRGAPAAKPASRQTSGTSSAMGKTGSGGSAGGRMGMHRTSSTGMGRTGSAGKPPRTGSKGRAHKHIVTPPEAGTLVSLTPGPAGDTALLQGETTLLGLKPEREYDVFVAVFDESAAPDDELEAAYQEPIAAASRSLRTCAGKPAPQFGADADDVLQLQTEEPSVARRACILALLGLEGAPCVVDLRTCELSCKASSKDAIKEHGVEVALDGHGLPVAGGLQLPAARLQAHPSYREGRVDLDLSVSAEAVARPCPAHCFSGVLQFPCALSLDGAGTTARCCDPLHDGDRCKACRWVKVELRHRLAVSVSVDLVRMAEIGDWRSVHKRISICQPPLARGAVAVMLAARPRLDIELIMRIFEGATGRSQEVDFPVRADRGTALHIASEEAHAKAVLALIKRKLDPSVQDAAGETPLHAAARGGGAAASQIAEALLAAARSTWRGEDRYVDDQEAARQSLLDHQDGEGRTALHLAAGGNQARLVKTLLHARADTRACDRVGCSALHASVAAGAIDATVALLDFGVRVDTPLGDARGCTALQLAQERGHTSMALLLLQRGADPQKGAAQANGHAARPKALDSAGSPAAAAAQSPPPPGHARRLQSPPTQVSLPSILPGDASKSRLGPPPPRLSNSGSGPLASQVHLPALLPARAGSPPGFQQQAPKVRRA